MLNRLQRNPDGMTSRYEIALNLTKRQHVEAVDYYTVAQMFSYFA